MNWTHNHQFRQNSENKSSNLYTPGACLIAILYSVDTEKVVNFALCWGISLSGS